jgi:hypothetical protein
MELLWIVLLCGVISCVFFLAGIGICVLVLIAHILQGE